MPISFVRNFSKTQIFQVETYFFFSTAISNSVLKSLSLMLESWILYSLDDHNFAFLIFILPSFLFCNWLFFITRFFSLYKIFIDEMLCKFSKLTWISNKLGNVECSNLLIQSIEFHWKNFVNFSRIFKNSFDYV